jgi:pyridoxine kinase
MNILSIQSEVVYGYVGQRAARFALQRLGHDVWSIPTVILSNHTGYAHVEGETIPADFTFKLTSGLVANDWLPHCDAVLSGYLGSAEQARIVGHMVRQVKAANPRAIYCLDPVFGDNGRAYAKPGVAEAMARTLLPLADVVTPNAFELSGLTSVPVRDVSDALVAAKRLGRPIVVGTSIPAGPDRIGTLAVEKDAAWFATTPRLDNAPHGAGDLFAALFLAAKLEGRPLRECLERATVSVYCVLERSVAAGSNEMLLIQSQEALLKPPAREEICIEQID